ncbi:MULTISPECIES: rhodanese-like domain-containing protein [Geobacter]|uniref:Sulfurtransferase n=2 Tax=Geobacter TaxID=28231 RepID=A0A0C1TK58_9BACT|nr:MULTISPECIES: rhodanese-like domain-containing protein [Geobacter]ANA39473.1 sulfurtransferase [Geobacter anodireducens]KIE41204.1 sulfurtransferase [Geobacter soli]MBE2886358.1 rhodanese-like domain-containing protein [Geobacter anodireducens]HMN01712.1 rhodanese-like domain-containing protein [Geobacter anodireducens]
MKSDPKRLAAEMAIIVAVAAIIGITWNYRLLADVFQGRAVGAGTPGPPPAATGTTAPVPLPLGLMQVKELFDRNEALIIDARDRDSYGAGHIRDAVLLPLGEADQLIPPLAANTPKDRFLIVYCNGYDCHDSRALGEKLIRAGFAQVYVFEGGFPEWRDAGYPVTTGGS